MKWEEWIYFLAAAAVLIIPTKHALHMFQQNRYECGRYSAWLRENLGSLCRQMLVQIILAAASAAIIPLFTASFAGWLFVILASGTAYYQLLKEESAVYIKPLDYTDRVKRQIAVLTALDLCWLIPLIRHLSAGTAWLIFVLAMFSAWLMIYPMAWLTVPVEKSVHNWYLNDARKILAAHSDLIKIGITGSYGKTSTKNIMQAMMSEQFQSLMTPASYNTPMGITRTIREQLKPIHQVFVCEMGADHVGDITELMKFVHPSIGVVTSIGPQHLNTFGSLENIVHEKMQMIECLPADGVGIINLDNELIRSYPIRNQVQIISYGIQNEQADYRAVDLKYSLDGSSFTVVHQQERIPFETRLLGELNILNILSAVAAARYLNISWPNIQQAVRTMKQVEHRLELKQINGCRFIDDAFNANPSGSAMALEVLKTMPGKRIIVTPGMIDLGEQQETVNRNFGTRMKGSADEVILVGENQTKPIRQGLETSGFDMEHVHVVKTEREAFALVYQIASAQDTILLENDLPDAFNS